jgi:hypothetical protein
MFTAVLRSKPATLATPRAIATFYQSLTDFIPSYSNRTGDRTQFKREQGTTALCILSAKLRSEATSRGAYAGGTLFPRSPRKNSGRKVPSACPAPPKQLAQETYGTNYSEVSSESVPSESAPWEQGIVRCWTGI